MVCRTKNALVQCSKLRFSIVNTDVLAFEAPEVLIARSVPVGALLEIFIG